MWRVWRHLVEFSVNNRNRDFSSAGKIAPTPYLLQVQKSLPGLGLSVFFHCSVFMKKICKKFEPSKARFLCPLIFLSEHFHNKYNVHVILPDLGYHYHREHSTRHYSFFLYTIMNVKTYIQLGEWGKETRFFPQQGT